MAIEASSGAEHRAHFDSDNGGVGGYVRDGLKKNKRRDDNAPLGAEGSRSRAHARLFIVGGGRGTAGAVCEVAQIHVDVYPTSRIAGAPMQPRF
jgi:hypothetical protein